MRIKFKHVTYLSFSVKEVKSVPQFYSHTNYSLEQIIMQSTSPYVDSP